jgi:hypothetical protein
MKAGATYIDLFFGPGRSKIKDGGPCRPEMLGHIETGFWGSFKITLTTSYAGQLMSLLNEA